MASCSFSSLIDDSNSCGQSLYYLSTATCVPLSECQKGVLHNLKSKKVSEDENNGYEMKLILARAGVFTVEEWHKALTICPYHRNLYGLGWRSCRTRCSVPQEIAAHKLSSTKGDRGINSVQSATIYRCSGILVPIGSPICRQCRRHIGNLKDEPVREQLACAAAAKPSEIADEGVPNTSPTILSEPMILEHNEGECRPMLEKASDSSDSSTEDIAKKLQELTIAHDDSYLPSPETSSTVSSVGGLDENDELRAKLNTFLDGCKLEPLGNKGWLEWDTVSQRTRRRYVNYTADAVAAMLKVISPENAAHLWQTLQSSKVVSDRLGIESPSLQSEKAYLETLAEVYKSATSWDIRRQVLSIMAGVTSYKVVCEFIPGLTSYRYTAAHLHRLQFGPGSPVPVQQNTRLRIDRGQLDHFLDFITSPHIVQDLPFGEKILHLSSGRSVTVPNVIRTMISQRIVHQYTNYCRETSFSTFTERTMLRILTACSASVRKSLQGLDYFAAEGAKAFDDLISLAEKVALVGPGQEWEREMTDGLKAGKLYLKGDYKVHVSEESCVPDHCTVFALSDASDSIMRQRCSHAHTERCGQCETLEELLETISKVTHEVNFGSDEDRDEALYLLQHAKQAIHLWKCHQIRTVRQDKARLDVLDRLDEATCLITNDWAMKFLPQRFRESQSDWFGKRGISWHISVVVRRVNGQPQTQSFIHVLQSSNQGSSTVVLLMEHVLRTLKAEHPEIKKVYFRQDNAGCYHCASTILCVSAIESSSGVSVLAVDFSDPQGGKGPADRMSATCKSHIRLYINEGHDVTTAEEMKSAILSHGGVEGVRIAVVKDMSESPVAALEQTKIPGINKLNNFQIGEQGVVARRAYCIGEGRRITDVEKTRETTLCWLKETFSAGDFKYISSPTRQVPVVPKSKVEPTDDSSPKVVYSCPQDGCTRVFQRYAAMERHLFYDKCTKSTERATLLDHAKKGYAARLLEGVGTIPSLSETPSTSARTTPLKEGWALKQAKKPYRFNEKQKSYLMAKFNIGQATGLKMDPEVVSKEMRRAKDSNGERLFTMPEFLTTLQVSSFFSRLAAKIRQQPAGATVEEEDIRAAHEDNFSRARESVLSALQLVHPIVCDQYNLCDMYKAGALAKQKLGLLQLFCSELELNIPSPPVRRKAPYVALLYQLVQGCSCCAGPRG